MQPNSEAGHDDELSRGMEEALRSISEGAPARPAPAVPAAPAPAPARPAAAAPAAPVTPLRQPLAPVNPPRTADQEMARFLDTASRMEGQVRRQMQEDETAYTIGRAKMGDDYRRRMEDLEIEAREALRKFDSTYKAERAKRQRMLDTIAAMRDI